MKISRRGYSHDHGETITPSTDNHSFSTHITGGKLELRFDAQEGTSRYQYKLRLTGDELVNMLLLPLVYSEIPKAESDLWAVMLEIWKERIEEYLE